MEETQVAAIFLAGDSSPLIVPGTVDRVLGRFLDAEAQAVEAGLPAESGWARFDTPAGPAVVRPGAVAAVLSGALMEDPEHEV